jgi:hypothetical protein
MPAGILAGVVFAAGLVAVFLVPVGGSTTDADITAFFDSSGKRLAALLLYPALLVGSWLMAWFFGELRRALPPGALGAYAERVAWLGATASVVGGAVALGPVAAQSLAGHEFVGVPAALALGQAGMGCLLVGGVYSFALAIFLLSVHAARHAALPRWQTTAGLVVAVLLLTAVAAMPAFLLPLWTVFVGLTVGTRRR